MIKKYLAWIETNFGHLSDAELACRCTPVSIRMKLKFPELFIMSGEVTTEDGNVSEHTWLQTEAGQIIDPTERQFSSEISEYHASLCDSTDPEQREQAESHFKEGKTCLSLPSVP